MQAPNRTTELISAAEDEGEFPGWHSPFITTPPEPAGGAAPAHSLALPADSGPSPAVQDTDSRGGGNGQDGAGGN